MTKQYVILFKALLQDSTQEIKCWKPDCDNLATMVFDLLNYQTATCNEHADDHLNTFKETHRIFVEAITGRKHD